MQGPKPTLLDAEQCPPATCTVPALFSTFPSLEDALFCNWTDKHQGFSRLRETAGA